MKNNLKFLPLLLIGTWILAFSCQNAPDKKQGQTPDYAKIYKDNFKPEKKEVQGILDDLSSFGMGTENTGQQDSLKAALELYEKGDYKPAQAALNAYVEAYPDDNIGKFYLGMCLMDMDLSSKAINLLLPLTELPDFELRDEATWYTALSYLILTDNTGIMNAKKYLTKLAKTNGSSYQEEAQIMLDQHFS